MAGTITAVCRAPAKGMQKTDIGECVLVEGKGMEGDAHFGFMHRQVSFLEAEEADKMRDKVPELKAGAFAENFLTRGFDLKALKIGDRITAGETLLEVTQIGKVCHDHCAIYEAAGTCIMPKYGVFCSVIRGGAVKTGDKVDTAS